MLEKESDAEQTKETRPEILKENFACIDHREEKNEYSFNNGGSNIAKWHSEIKKDKT